MRFDKNIELLKSNIVEDGLGGRTIDLIPVYKLNANVVELSLEATQKIYGEATTGNIKVTILGKILKEFDRVKYKNNLYEIKSKRILRNKSCYLLEVVEDEI